MDAVIHVGMHKAASTYIQSLLKENREALADAGVLAWTRHGHANLKATRNGPQPIRGAHTMLTRYVAEFETGKMSLDYDYAVMSDEALEFLLSDKLNFYLMERKLKSMFDRFSYLVIVRNPISMQATMVQQRVKTFRVYDTELPAVITGKPLFMHPLNYLHRFRQLLKSDRKTTFVPMHELIAETGPVMLDRLVRQELGVALITFRDAAVKNSSIGSTGVAFSSFFRFCMLQSLQRKNIPSYLAQKVKNEFMKHCKSHGWDSERFFPFDENYVARLERRLAKTKAAFARRAWNKSWEEVFPAENHRLSVFDWASMDDTRFAQLESVFAQCMDVFRSQSANHGPGGGKLQFEPLLAAYLRQIRGIDPG